jgi:hypothetical protein
LLSKLKALSSNPTATKKHDKRIIDLKNTKTFDSYTVMRISIKMISVKDIKRMVRL